MATLVLGEDISSEREVEKKVLFSGTMECGLSKNLVIVRKKTGDIKRNTRGTRLFITNAHAIRRGDRFKSVSKKDKTASVENAVRNNCKRASTAFS